MIKELKKEIVNYNVNSVAVKILAPTPGKTDKYKYLRAEEAIVPAKIN